MSVCAHNLCVRATHVECCVATLACVMPVQSVCRVALTIAECTAREAVCGECIVWDRRATRQREERGMISPRQIALKIHPVIYQHCAWQLLHKRWPRFIVFF